MAECKECAHYGVCCKLVGKDKIDRVSWMCHFPDDCSEFKSIVPQTNADRIRAMSDEELAEDYCKTLLKVMQYFGIKNTGILEDAVRARLEWLQQPAEE